MVQYSEINKYDTSLKDKNHMTISINAESALDKIQHPFMIKTLQSGNSRSIPQHNKGHIWKTYFPLTLNTELYIPVLKKWRREREIKVNISSIVIFLAPFSDCLFSICILNIPGAEMNMYFLEELYFEVIKTFYVFK